MGSNGFNQPRSRWALKKRVVELEATVQARDRQIAVLKRELKSAFSLISALLILLQAAQEKAKRFARMLFGRSSERQSVLQDATNNTPSKAADGEEDVAGSSDTKIPSVTKPSKRRRGAQPGHKGHGRRIPKHLPVEDRIHELPESEQVCSTCGKLYRALGEGAEEVSYEVDVRIEYVLIRHRRPKYVRGCTCPDVPAVSLSPPPVKLVPKGMLTVGTVVHLLIQKYLAHVPFARQVRLLDEQGVSLSCGTVANYMKRVLGLFRPLYHHLWEMCRQQKHWHIDETSWRVFAEREGKKGHRWWMWIWTTDRMTLFVLDPTRSSDVVITWMDDAEGIATTDAFSAYTRAAGQMPLTLHGCWAHARRDMIPYLEEEASDDPTVQWMQARAKEIGTLYAAHAERGRHPQNSPLWNAAQHQLAKSFNVIKMAWQAVVDAPEAFAPPVVRIANRLQRDWEALTLPLDHPELPLDNNQAERQLRELVLERHTIPGNHSEWGGQLTAVISSILLTCRQNNVNPSAYLHFYLEACLLPGGGARAPTDLDPYLPWNLRNWVPPNRVG